MLTETGYETIKSHDLLSLWGVDGGGGFVNLERFVEGVVGGVGYQNQTSANKGEWEFQILVILW